MILRMDFDRSENSLNVSRFEILKIRFEKLSYDDGAGGGSGRSSGCGCVFSDGTALAIDQ